VAEEVEVMSEIASPVDLIVIDYLQLMDYGGGRESEATKIAHITRGLKQLAKRLSAHVLLVSQFNRINAVSGRDPRGPRLECPISGERYPRPSMHNLLGSGSIEQDADKVILLQNHNYDIAECRQHIEIVLDKNRAGETAHGTMEKWFEYSAFKELDTRAGVEFR